MGPDHQQRDDQDDQEFLRPDWRVRVESEVSVRCTSERFHMQGWVKAYDDGKLFAERRFEEVIARDFL